MSIESIEQFLPSYFCLIITVLSVTFQHSNLLPMQNLNSQGGINFSTFKADICQLISPTLCPYEMLDDSLRLILEKHALLCSCGVPINQNDQWFNAMKSDIIASKYIDINRKTVLKKSNYSE